MIRLSGAVMAHPERLDKARALAGGDLAVVADPDPSGRPSAFRTSLLAWSSVPGDSTHHFLLHDDMTLSASFRSRAERAAAARPDAALALFAFWNSRNGAAVRQGALAGARWVRAAREYMPTAALLLPADVARAYVAYAERVGDTWPDDVIMGRFLRSAGIPSYVAVPSLAQHDDLASLVQNDFQGLRRAPVFFPDDPRLSDGEQPCLDALSATPFFKQGFAQCAVDGRTIPVEEYLRRFGLRDLRPDLDPVARGVWLTAYAMGVVNRLDGHDVHDDAVLDRALSTIAPGGLCNLPGTPPPASDLARQGLEAGLAARPRRARRGSVRVTGKGFAAEHVRRTLAERGVASDTVIHLRALDDKDIPPDGYVLRTGLPYGPGMPPDHPVAHLVRRALLTEPLDLTELRPVRLIHLQDITDAAEQVLTSQPDQRVHDLPSTLITPTNLAAAIGQAVRPVQITGPPDAPDQTPKEPNGTPLEYGLHTCAQWLAYEADDD